MPRLTLSLLFALSMLTFGAAVRAADPPRRTLDVELGGRRIEGMPLSWSALGVQLLGRDGRLYEFSPNDAGQARQSSSTFRAYPASHLRNTLQQELGSAFEVAATQHFVVAYPRGKRGKWVDRFESLYRQFQHYFSVRGFRLNDPEFPLVAIIYPNQQSFMAAAKADGSSAGPGVMGYYSPRSNRVMMFDVGGGAGGAAAARETDATVIHEATHQAAFNSGIHRRFAETPAWVIEGLGTMFEAPGVWDSRSYKRREDRVNRGRLDDYRRLVATQSGSERLVEMLRSDAMIRGNPQFAYAQAWALTFWLVETQPRKFAEYLERTTRRPVFQEYPAAERLKDFTDVFGSNFALLDAQFRRFMQDVR